MLGVVWLLVLPLLCYVCIGVDDIVVVVVCSAGDGYDVDVAGAIRDVGVVAICVDVVICDAYVSGSHGGVAVVNGVCGGVVTNNNTNNNANGNGNNNTNTNNNINNKNTTSISSILTATINVNINNTVTTTGTANSGNTTTIITTNHNNNTTHN